MPKQRYDKHPSVAKVEKWTAELPEKTGRSLDQWMPVLRAHAKKAGGNAAKQTTEWLKREHGLGTTTAWWLVERALAKDLAFMDDNTERYLANCPRYVDEQFAGKKSHLRPVYDALFTLARSIAPDIKVCPCKTIVPIYREHVIAQIAAPNNSRVDFGLSLAAYTGTIPKRLIDTGGKEKKDRITHRVELTDTDQIDAFVEKWLRIAYDFNAPASPSTKRPGAAGKKLTKSKG